MHTKFPLGQLVITRHAAETLSAESIAVALRRHAIGDWGELTLEDVQANERSLADGSRLLSSYRTENDTAFWIITEADRSVTTVLLPEDY